MLPFQKVTKRLRFFAKNMTIEEVHILSSNEVREILFENREKNPAEFALSTTNSPYPTPLLATQLKYWQRAKDKLPSFYAVGAIIPPISYEQCSSEKAAAAKDFAGKTCLDLTCGLGVDSLHFSTCFEKVIAVEREPVLAEITKYNFALLSKSNIEIHNTSAEDFLQNYTGETFDLIYLDPSRRDDKGGKVFLPQDCSPNLREMLPLLLQKGKKIVVKFSPLYDISAAQSDFPEMTEIQVLSIENECKEVILIFESLPKNLHISLICNKQNTFSRFSFPISKEKIAAFPPQNPHISIGMYIYEPDVVFYKSRLTTELFSKYYPEYQGFMSHQNGFFFSMEKIEAFVGRVFRILAVWEYQPKKIKAFCKENKLLKINILQRNFPFSVEKIRESLSLKEGGNHFLVCTSIEGKNHVFYAEKVIT